jgi:1-acyl-sn-glycerol-3-phosphate acyltransferase
MTSIKTRINERHCETPSMDLLRVCFYFVCHNHVDPVSVCYHLLIFGRIRGGNAIFKICRIWADLWFPLIFILPRRIYETLHNRSKPYIFVINHSSLLDATLLPKAFHQPVRPLGKVEMSKIPVFGFIYRKAIVAVDRNDATNRAQSIGS